jgi:DNA-3-methyladenine glycosylase I
MSYCAYVASLTVENVHRIYHDLHYGTPIYDDNELFGRLILEINQAGLSWDTILKKEANFRKAYDNYDIATIANYQNDDFERLLQDVGVIRNRLKINAAIYNAQQIKLIQQEFGSFKSWLDHHCENTRLQWTQLFKKTFKFVGGEIVNEFLMSTGYLPGAHVESCFRFEQLNELK